MAEIHDVRDQLAVLLAAPREVVGGDEDVRRAGEAPVALEAGADKGLVGQVRADEQAGDPVEERRLGQGSGSREQAVDGPLDAIGEGCRRGLPVGAIAQPPAIVGDAHEAHCPPPRRARRGRGRAAGRRDRRTARVCARRDPRAVGRRVLGLRRRTHQSPEVPGPVEADEDLAQQAREADGLAAQLEHVDAASTTARAASSAENGASATRSGGANRRSSRDDVRVAGAARDRRAGATFARVRGPPGTAPEPGGTSSTTPPVSRPASGSRAAGEPVVRA